MAIPTSAQFDLLDWNSRALSELPAIGLPIAGAVDSLPVHWQSTGSFLVDGDNGVIAGALGKTSQAATPATARANLSPSIAGSYTFELDVLVTDDLPEDLNDAQYRCFIGVQQATGWSAGVLLTKRGIAVAGHAAQVHPLAIGGTGALLYDDRGVPQAVTVRLVVDAVEGRVAVYAGVAATTYDAAAGSGWRTEPNLALYGNVAAFAPQGGVPPGLLLYLSAPTVSSWQAAHPYDAAPQGRDLLVYLRSLRLSSQKLLPQNRPVAVVTGAGQGALGQVLRLFGNSSFDAYGATLGYDWSIEHAPPGSNARLQGAVAASVSTAADPAAPDDGDLVFALRTASSAGNAYTVAVVATGTPNAELTLALTDKTLTISLATNGASVPTSTAADVRSAFSDELSSSYLAALDAFTAEYALLGSAGGGLLPAGTYPLAGGTGSALPDTLLMPDVAGLYAVGLVVYSPTRRSAKVLKSVLIADTDQLLGHFPDTSYIFKYLSDFWQLVDGRERVEPLWSAVAQVVSSEMLALWQHDYAKSLRDISRKYQRRWLSFASRHEIDPALCVLVTPALLGTTALVAASPASAAAAQPDGRVLASTVAFVGSYSRAPRAPGPHLWRGGDTRLAPTVINIGSITQHADVWGLTEAAGVPVATRLLAGTDGTFLTDTDYPGPPVTSRVFRSFGQRFDEVTVAAAPAAQYYTRVRLGSTWHCVHVLAKNPQTNARSLQLDMTPQDVNGQRIAWELLHQVADARVTATPYFVLDASLLLDVEAGDLVALTLAHPYASSTLQVLLPVIARKGVWLVPDWQPLLRMLQTMSLVSDATDAAGAPLVWTEDMLGQLGLRLVAVCRTRQPGGALADLLHVPTLGGTSLQGLYEGKDHVVDGARVALLPYVSGQIQTTAGSAYVQLHASRVLHPDVDLTVPFAELAPQGIRTLHIATGPDAGNYTIVGKGVGETFVLDRLLSSSGTALARVERHNHLAPPPARYWAEVCFFDNWQAIEANYGLLVGLPKQAFVDAGVTTDYLSAVKGLAVAFVGGSTLQNLELMADGLTGMPFTEHTGQLLSVVEPTDTRAGHLVYLDAYAREVVYPWPYGLELATNPATGRQIKAHAYVADATVVLDKPALADAQLRAYVPLLSAVRLHDRITSPLLISDVLAGQDIVRQTHTYLVEVPLGPVATTAAFGLLKTFMREAAPAWTDFVLYGALRHADDINVQDTLRARVTVKLKDTPHTPPIAAAWSGQLLSGLWPTAGVLARGWDAAEAFEKYESTGQDGVADDWSGDGSNNATHRMVDQINAADSDIDVLNSKLWVPVLIDAGNLAEFVVGETLDVYVAGAMVVAADSPWVLSPPVVLHVGAGTHPQLPFGIASPQLLHPHSYLLLGFERPQPAESLSGPGAASAVLANYGTEARLDALHAYKLAADALLGTLVLRGHTSQAEATPTYVPSLVDVADQARYFVLRRYFDADRLLDLNPRCTVQALLTAYIPVGGIKVDAFRALSASFDPALSPRFGKQVQQHPYDSGMNEDFQFAPSNGPGVYSDWLGVDVVNDDLSWGYLEPGALPLLLAPTNISDFATAAGVSKLENVHIGVRVTARTGRHYTHGFVLETIPAPEVLRVTTSGATVRVQGNYLIDKDATQVAPPADTPASFSGTKVGSWLFFRKNGTLNELAATNVVFETGLNAGKTVLWLDGAAQTSTGHILEAPIPAGLPEGLYDVILRQYRTYQLDVAGGSPVLYHMDTCVALEAFTALPAGGGFGAGGFGAAPFGA